MIFSIIVIDELGHTVYLFMRNTLVYILTVYLINLQLHYSIRNHNVQYDWKLELSCLFRLGTLYSQGSPLLPLHHYCSVLTVLTYRGLQSYTQWVTCCSRYIQHVTRGTYNIKRRYSTVLYTTEL